MIREVSHVCSRTVLGFQCTVKDKQNFIPKPLVILSYKDYHLLYFSSLFISLFREDKTIFFCSTAWDKTTIIVCLQCANVCDFQSS